MELREFTNGLRILRSIDRDELLGVGINQMADDRHWVAFREAPADWLLRCSDEDAAVVWLLMRDRGA